MDKKIKGNEEMFLTQMSVQKDEFVKNTARKKMGISMQII